ncbi:MAG: 50S ribosomal protein L25 [Candidatus Eremiobacteraeota bacterium]|nr:50S ribosomal protein L25 [Candidatus Eremiobacteraeota bacterium]MBV9263654.1 50S ribosomal protein L25 [Candidatus Eremiobacteraeota bacterium]
MPKKDLTLTTHAREKLGTTGAQALRAEGKIPAVVYGHGAAPEHIALDAHDFGELLHHGGRNAIITLADGRRKRETAIVRQVQTHPVSRRIVHADLQRVSANEAIDARLQIVTVGVAEGVRNFGAVMDVIAHELEVEGPANRIPENLEIDVSGLNVHEHVTAGDVKLPEGFRLLTPPETVVVTIEPSRTAQEVEEAAAPAEEAAEPQVIGAEPQAATEAQ